MQFLLFTLHAPLAAHGDVGPLRTRGSWSRPSRSAVLGLVAGCLGIDREDDATHQALANGYGFAVRIDAPGETLVDYHTISHAEVPTGSRPFRTRAQELEHRDVGTVPTWREYRTDGLYTVVLWSRDSARWQLADLVAALQHPVWTPYVGRKSAVLGLPMAPELVEADGLVAALANRPAVPPALAAWLTIRMDEHPELACDADAPGVKRSRATARRDGYGGRRLFVDRSEYIMNL